MHKLASLNEGFVTKESLWDRLISDGARAAVLGNMASTLRGAVVSDGESYMHQHLTMELKKVLFSSGSLNGAVVMPTRIALSIPIINIYTHPIVPRPVLALHPFNFQDFPSFKDSLGAHVGPPSMNIEVKLIGVDDKKVETGENPTGNLLIHGPPVGKLLLNGDNFVLIPSEDEKEGWVAAEVQAKVQSNGAFKILS